jgi:penicillin G amidase
VRRRLWLKITAAVIVVLLVAASVVVFSLARRGLPVTQGVIQAEVGAAVEIYRDQFGIPHIIGISDTDVAFAQGYAQAQDRLWQMDMSRRGVGGRLSEILGADFLGTDRFTLTIGFYRAARDSYQVLSPESRAVLEAYTRGVNAYLADNRGKLSPEFTLIGYEPEPWDPVDSVAISKYMAWYLGGNMQTELLLATLINELGEVKARELFPKYPADGPIIVPTLNDEPAFSSADSAGLLELSRLAELNGRTVFVPGLGSNNWVVSGEKTATGAALLANDMHLGMGVPSIWYANHLVLEGEYNVTGVIFPGIPGVIVGYNDQIAWGVTNTGPDVQDLYLITLNPDNPHQYRYLDQWVDAEVIVEEIAVKGEAEPARLEIVITRHGPIISDVSGLEQPISLRWTALEATHEFDAVLGFFRAENWVEFCAALEYFMAPAQNFVYADREGNIGYRANGLIPIRRNGSGLLPVDGSTDEYEWDGYIPWDELPQLYNPPGGVIVTANHRVVDDDYPYFISAEWAPQYRAQGIWRELEGRAVLTMDDMIRAQSSFYNTQAELLAPVLVSALEGAQLAGPEQEVFLIFRDWLREPVEEPGSAGPAVYHTLYLKMVEETFLDEMGEELFERYLSSRNLVNTFDQMLLNGDSAWFANINTAAEESREDMIARAFDAAVAELTDKLGADVTRWQWGELHSITFKHEMGSVKALQRFFNRGPHVVGGSGHTPANMSFPPGAPFAVTHSAPWRYMVDLNDLSGLDALAIGNSGHPFSRHYDDQLELWLAGRVQGDDFRPGGSTAAAG